MSHSDRALLAGALLAALALLLLSFGVADGGAGRVEAASAATGQPQRSPGTLPVRAPSRTGARAVLATAPAPRPAEPRPAPDTEILTVRPGATVALRDRPGGEIAGTVGERTEFDSATVLTVLERRGGWAGVPTQLRPNGRLAWVRIGDPGLERGSVGQSIVIDLSEMRGELSRKGVVERRWKVGIGAPGTPTPTGRFSVTDEIEGGLNPVYGCCAIALSATQPNLPAGWTGGDRIAIHGTSKPLGEANSTGCVHSSDDDLRALIERVPLGTPVTIRR